MFWPQIQEPEWFVDNPPTLSWQSYRRTDMKRLFRTRKLTPQPATLVVPVVMAHDLSKFVFGELNIVQGKLIKYMWHFPVADNDKYITVSQGAVEKKVEDKDFSSRIESSEAIKDVRMPFIKNKQISLERNWDWYQSLLAQ